MADWNINIDNITCNAAVLKLEKPSDNTNEFPDSFRLEVDSAQYTFPLNSNDIENPDNMSVLTQDLTFYPTLDSTSGSYTAQIYLLNQDQSVETTTEINIELPDCATSSWDQNNESDANNEEPSTESETDTSSEDDATTDNTSSTEPSQDEKETDQSDEKSSESDSLPVIENGSWDSTISPLLDGAQETTKSISDENKEEDIKYGVPAGLLGFVLILIISFTYWRYRKISRAKENRKLYSMNESTDDLETQTYRKE